MSADAGITFLDDHDISAREVQVLLSEVISLVDTLAKGQGLSTLLNSAHDLSVYYAGTRVSAVTLSASMRTLAASNRTSNEAVDLVVQAMLDDVNTLDELDNIYLAPDDVWTQATIIDEQFFTQEDD